MAHDWSAFPHDDLEAAKKFGCDFYSTIGRIKCPALNDEHVAFNSKGIGHILYKKTRTPKEIIDRLSHLRYAESIIIDPYAKIIFEKFREKDYLKKKGVFGLYEVEAQYWNFIKEVQPNLVIKVVVRQLDAGGKYFYSIMQYYGK